MEIDQSQSSVSESHTTVLTCCLRRRIVLPSNLPTASQLLGARISAPKIYWDRSHYDSPASQLQALSDSSTLYIGNLAFSTRSSHVRALFSQIGPVNKVVMGLDRIKKTPCGFAFVEYRYQKDAKLAIACLTGAKLDGRIVRVELDAGFKPGREYGRGKCGGQVRDDRRTRDPDRTASRTGSSQECSRSFKIVPSKTAGSGLNWQPPDQATQLEGGNHAGGSMSGEHVEEDNQYIKEEIMDGAEQDS